MKRLNSLPLLAAVGLFCTLLMLTHLFVRQLQVRAEAAAEYRFNQFATDSSNKVQTQLIRYIDVLPGLRGLWSIFGSPTRMQFLDYVASLELPRRFPSLRNVNFADYIRTEDTEQYQIAVRKQDGNPQFAVFPRQTTHDHRLVVRMGAPNSNTYFGRDIAQNFATSVVLDSVKSMQPAASGEAVAQLDGHTGAALGIRLAFFSGPPSDNFERRLSQFIGSGGIFVDVNSLVHEAVPDEDWRFLGLTVRSLPNPGEASATNRRVLFSFVPAGWVSQPAQTLRRTFVVAGRQFVLDFSVPAHHFDDPISGKVILIGFIAGSLFSALASLALHRLLTAQRELKSTVLHQSESLATSESRMSRLLEEQLRAEQEITRQAERERQRIGRELHDDLGQKLTGASLLLGTLLRSSTPGPGLSEKVIERVSTIVEDGIDTIRALSRGLTPFDGSPHDLDAALRELCSEVSKLLPKGCHLACAYDTGLLSPEASLHLYRIVQESVSNALRHGHATRIAVELHDHDGRIFLQIIDDGIGFPADISMATAPTSSLGLRSIRSRAQLLGLTARFYASVGGGTTIEVS